MKNVISVVHISNIKQMSYLKCVIQCHSAKCKCSLSLFISTCRCFENKKKPFTFIAEQRAAAARLTGPFTHHSPSMPNVITFHISLKSHIEIDIQYIVQ